MQERIRLTRKQKIKWCQEEHKAFGLKERKRYDMMTDAQLDATLEEFYVMDIQAYACYS